ncbi:HNH endonuclease [Escherichia phage vB_EcoS_AHP42]|uniref:HNH endonuclease n=1 Tax=Escherichia phage vB_EcoS_AHP42 TaxID=1416028 RepID=A0A067YYB3_9CAUD|nr:HNH endonuclease [Escherichia phage vB_EcoS_AHP42]AHI60592.1 HNH endonuclease [Escherichia phage vB_EcoS_AHP42]
MNWNDFLEYRDGKLYWTDPHSTKFKPGDEAGCRHHRGYHYIRRYNTAMSRHRIVLTMFNGEIPEGMEIDHIDHDVDNDRIENLRMVTRRQNNQNKKLDERNTSGHVGVSWNKKTNKWRAMIGIKDNDGKRKTVYVYYGDSFDDAVLARKKAEAEYSFHENHGK